MLTLQYFNYAALAQAAELQLCAGRIPYVRKPLPKRHTHSSPFGSIPLLHARDCVIAGGPAVERFCAKAAGLMPSSDILAAQTEAIMDECMSVYAKMEECRSSRNKRKAWTAFETKYLPDKLSQFLHHFDDDYYGGRQPNAADISLFSILHLLERANVGWKHDNPELANFYAEVSKVGHIPRYIDEDLPCHFSSDFAASK